MFAEVVVVANTIILCVTVSSHFVLNHIHGYSSSSSCFTKLFMRSVCVSQILFAVAIFFVSNLNTDSTHNIFRRFKQKVSLSLFLILLTNSNTQIN